MGREKKGFEERKSLENTSPEAAVLVYKSNL